MLLTGSLLSLRCEALDEQPDAWLDIPRSTLPAISPQGHRHWSTEILFRILPTANHAMKMRLYDSIGFIVTDEKGLELPANYIRDVTRRADSRDILFMRPKIVASFMFVAYLQHDKLVIEDGTFGRFEFKVSKAGRLKIEFYFKFDHSDPGASVRALEEQYAINPATEYYRSPITCSADLLITELPTKLEMPGVGKEAGKVEKGQ